MNLPTNGDFGRWADANWMRFAARIALILLAIISYFGKRTLDDMRDGQTSLINIVAAAEEDRTAIKLENARISGRVEALEEYAKEGGRYTQEEATRDWAKQDLRDDRQDTAIRALGQFRRDGSP